LGRGVLNHEEKKKMVLFDLSNYWAIRIWILSILLMVLGIIFLLKSDSKWPGIVLIALGIIILLIRIIF